MNIKYLTLCYIFIISNFSSKVRHLCTKLLLYKLYSLFVEGGKERFAYQPPTAELIFLIHEAILSACVGVIDGYGH